MSVGSMQILDALLAVRLIAMRNLGNAGTLYQMIEPEVTTSHIVAVGSGDALSIYPAPCVLRAVRIFNTGSVACFAKFHNIASAPTPGSGVVFAVACQASISNPDPRLSGGGRAFSTGLGFSLVTGLADSSSTGVVAGSVLVELELHPA